MDGWFQFWLCDTLVWITPIYYYPDKFKKQCWWQIAGFGVSMAVRQSPLKVTLKGTDY